MCIHLRRGAVIVTLTTSLNLGSAGAVGGDASATNEPSADAEDDSSRAAASLVHGAVSDDGSTLGQTSGSVLALTATRQFAMSWGVATAFFHVRL